MLMVMAGTIERPIYLIIATMARLADRSSLHVIQYT